MSCDISGINHRRDVGVGAMSRRASRQRKTAQRMRAEGKEEARSTLDDLIDAHDIMVI